MKIRKILAAALVALGLVAATSCDKDDTLRYNNLSLGFVEFGRFISDNGNKFNVVENVTKDDLLKFEGRRVVTVCDILNKTEGKDSEYDVRLKFIDEPYMRDAVKDYEAAEYADLLVEDPIYIESVWVSGGYLNIMFSHEYELNSSVQHLFSIVVNTETIEDRTIQVSLRHNAYGETYEKLGPKCAYKTNVIATYPLNTMVESPEEYTDMKISFKWYMNATPNPAEIKEYTYPVKLSSTK